MKLCNVCKTEYPRTTEYFYASLSCKDGLRGVCRSCIDKKAREYRAKDKELNPQKYADKYLKNRTKILAEKKKEYNKNPDKYKSRQRKYNKTPKGKFSKRLFVFREYGLTDSDVMDLMNKQMGCCDICSNSLDSLYHIDHNHDTGKVRGLLCHHCNTAIGLLKESEHNFLSSIEYLRKHNSLR